MLNIISDSKESSQLQSANFYLDAVENAIALSTLYNKKLTNGYYSILRDGNICIEYKDEKCVDKLKIEVKGEIPIGGAIVLKNGKIDEIRLKYGNKKVVGYDEDKKLAYIVPPPYQESENIEIPDLYNNTLTPVIYDGDDWVIADVTEKWYDYSNQKWANAVILNNSVKKEIGDAITVDGENPDALAMFVWIPRYEYKIEGKYGKGGTSKASPGEIEVNFINMDTKEASDTYRIHPAFNFGEGISGIWVGKFELSHITKTTSSLGCTTETCAESDNLRVLPNVRSLRQNNVSSFFYAIRSMNKDKNVFGIDSSITDTHMMKNSEWGAVAYLSQSKYGKYGNKDYSGLDKEVYINNSSSYYTGRSGGSYGGNTAVKMVYASQPNVTTLYVGPGYYTYDGYLLEYNKNNQTNERYLDKISSTTGNIYGIYDMSGGAWEYTMGVFANSFSEKWSGSSCSSNSGFVGKTGTDGIDIEGIPWPNEKYYDTYQASSGTTIEATTACNGGVCFGHALSETAVWYSDYSFFVESSDPWFRRGGDCETSSYAGLFNYRNHNGGQNYYNSTRVVFTSAT